MSRVLTQRGLDYAARRLLCSTQVVRAVLQVETNGSGFLPDGRPKILFERHIFHRRTGGYKSDLSDPTPGGYVGGAGEYDRLYRAMQLAPLEAIESCSWGIAQIMGFNWKLCGERSILGFLLAMHNNEDAQLALMCEFIASIRAADALRSQDWAEFAERYNGPAYKKNKYDEKLAAAYRNLEPA